MSKTSLYLESVSTELMELLRAVQSNERFRQLRLVGGTALALQYGHRKSVDLDFFGSIMLSDDEITAELSKLGKVQALKRSLSIKIYSVNGIKIDLVNYPFPWLQVPVLYNNLILASDKDIAAMKIAAITGRGSKKDFIDLYFLLKKYSLPEIFSFYTQKYPDASEYLALKSLVYFQDAEEQETPEMLIPAPWSTVKAYILKVHRDHMA